MRKRKEYDTEVFWGLAADYFANGRGLFRTKREASAARGGMHGYDIVRITLTWERERRKRRTVTVADSRADRATGTPNE